VAPHAIRLPKTPDAMYLLRRTFHLRGGGVGV
jgi:hypothetical protein